MLAGASPATAAAAGRREAKPLTNLAHLNWLGDTVDPRAEPGHTTYRLAEQPGSASCGPTPSQDDGVLKRVGGGAYDAATNTYGQGAFNADDIVPGRRRLPAPLAADRQTTSREHARTSCCAD